MSIVGHRSQRCEGLIFSADFCSGKIWALAQGGDGWRSIEMLDTALNLSSFGEDETGELYVTDLTGGGVYRVTAE